jgi:hypothetical protein
MVEKLCGQKHAEHREKDVGGRQERWCAASLCERSLLFASPQARPRLNSEETCRLNIKFYKVLARLPVKFSTLMYANLMLN